MANIKGQKNNTYSKKYVKQLLVDVFTIMLRKELQDRSCDVNFNVNADITEFDIHIEQQQNVLMPIENIMNVAMPMLKVKGVVAISLYYGLLYHADRFNTAINQAIEVLSNAENRAT